MTFWIDAQLSPALAPWSTETFGLAAYSASYLGFRAATDETIFEQARAANVVVITKDIDFVNLLNRYGSPPKVIWLTCGNTANQRVRDILTRLLSNAVTLLETSDLVEITG